MPAVFSRFWRSGAVPRHMFVNCLASGSLALWLLHLISRYHQRRSKQEKQVELRIKQSGNKAEKAAVDARFVARLRRILAIVVPRVFCSQSAYALAVALVLVARTVCDVWQIRNVTAIESSLIQRDGGLFMGCVWEYTRMIPVVALVNTVLKYCLAQLQLGFRVALTTHLYDEYMRGFTFYQMSNLDSRIDNADHLLTSDVNQLCTGMVDLYSNLSKPVLDICLYVNRLSAKVGRQVPLYMLLYMVVSGGLLTSLRRPIGSMTVKEQSLEGEFRFINSRLITNSEEVAFYQGSEREKATLKWQFHRLVRHLKMLLHFKFSVGFIDNIIAKYLATLVGFFSVSLPFLSAVGPISKLTPSSRQQQYYETGRMMVRLAESIGRLVLAGREMTRLSGFTVRVDRLLSVLADLRDGKYQRTMVTSDNAKTVSVAERSAAAAAAAETVLDPSAGSVILQDHVIRFDNVPLVTPNGDMLVSQLNFEVKSGMNVLVCGPNGCGKSSLFRILGELWPVFGGTLTKPHRSKLFYIPQRPYMTLGTLRDQVIYPDSVDEMRGRGVSDEQLRELLCLVQLEYVLERDAGWDTLADWADVLSGGEKQRVAMARLFYHRPQFAILDECTSAVSVDVEGSMYQHCRGCDITLFTVSHRKSLWIHHEYYLQMDGRGGFVFERITDGTHQFGS